MPSADNYYNGEIVKFGGGSTSVGRLYYLNSSQVWTQANATAASTSINMLGIALGTNPGLSGMLIRGFIRSSLYNYTVGLPLYVSKTAGLIVSSIALYTTGNVVRVVGYNTEATNDVIYFNPDNTWVLL
jgi:hypothetical protein